MDEFSLYLDQNESAFQIDTNINESQFVHTRESLLQANKIKEGLHEDNKILENNFLQWESKLIDDK